MSRDFFVARGVAIHYNYHAMKLESEGILIGLRPISERDSVASIFTREYGTLSGVMRGAIVAKKNRPLVGQIGFAAWNARLDSQLGAFHWESTQNVGAPLMMDAKKLGFMNSAFALVMALLPEREEYTRLYDSTINMLRNLGTGDSEYTYLNWEIDLLHDLGYALDLSRCSGCGRVGHLNYLSPKTGRAVCDDCAAPYMDKVYKLPMNLDITGHFIARICDQMGVNMPVARVYLSRQ